MQLRAYQGHPGGRRHRDGENQHPPAIPPPAVGQKGQDCRTEAGVGGGRGGRRCLRCKRQRQKLRRGIGAEKAPTRPPTHQPQQSRGQQQSAVIVTTWTIGLVKLTLTQKSITKFYRLIFTISIQYGQNYASPAILVHMQF